MTTLTTIQKTKITDALERGVKDSVIARALPMPIEEVRTHRKSLGITREHVTNVRHEYWKKMLCAGKSLEEIAQLYGVKPHSVKLMLWKKERFSLVDAKKQYAQELATLKAQTRAADAFSW